MHSSEHFHTVEIWYFCSDYPNEILIYSRCKYLYMITECCAGVRQLLTTVMCLSSVCLSTCVLRLLDDMQEKKTLLTRVGFPSNVCNPVCSWCCAGESTLLIFVSIISSVCKYVSSEVTRCCAGVVRSIFIVFIAAVFSDFEGLKLSLITEQMICNILK